MQAHQRVGGLSFEIKIFPIYLKFLQYIFGNKFPLQKKINKPIGKQTTNYRSPEGSVIIFFTFETTQN